MAVSSMSKARSRVTNGRSMFVERGTDERSPVARRLRDLVRLHTLDISPQGAEHLSAAQAQLIRRISMIEVQAELMEARMVDGDKEVDVESFARISSHLRRMYESLGLRKTARDTTPSIDKLIAQRRLVEQRRLDAENTAERGNAAAATLVADALPEPISNHATPVVDPVEEVAS